MKTKYYGYLIIFLTSLLLIYHSLWIYAKVKKILIIIYKYFLQPFFKQNIWFDKFFPDKYWALAIPAYGASLTYSFSFIFLGWIFILSYKEKEKENEDDEIKSNDIQHDKIE